MEKSKRPHYAQINFRIDIRPVEKDGSLSHDKLSEAELESFDLSSFAVFGIDGFNLDDCVQKLKQALERLRYE